MADWSTRCKMPYNINDMYILNILHHFLPIADASYRSEKIPPFGFLTIFWPSCVLLGSLEDRRQRRTRKQLVIMRRWQETLMTGPVGL